MASELPAEEAFDDNDDLEVYKSDLGSSSKLVAMKLHK